MDILRYYNIVFDLRYPAGIPVKGIASTELWWFITPNLLDSATLRR